MPPPNHKHTMNNIVSKPFYYEKLTYTTANGILAALFYRMLGELNISLTAWGQLLNDFVSDSRNGLKDDNQKDKTSMRGNLTKEFGRLAMTWKVFIKGLKILQIVRFQITIEAVHGNGVVTKHTTNWITLRDKEAGNLNPSNENDSLREAGEHEEDEEVTHEHDEPGMTPIKRAAEQQQRDDYDQHTQRQTAVAASDENTPSEPNKPSKSLFERP